jgi:hypothetical protein
MRECASGFCIGLIYNSYETCIQYQIVKNVGKFKNTHKCVYPSNQYD